MTALTLWRREPIEPPGWRISSCSRVMPRMRMTDTASASPKASIRVVEVVGEILAGQASRALGSVRQMPAICIIGEWRCEVMPITGQPSARAWRMMWPSSAVAPELESATSTSAGVIMPRSP